MHFTTDCIYSNQTICICSPSPTPHFAPFWLLDVRDYGMNSRYVFLPPPPSDLTWKCIRLVYFQINITNNGFLFLQGVFLNFLVNYGFLRSVFYILNLSWKSLTLFSDFPNVFSIFGMESRPSFEWKKNVNTIYLFCVKFCFYWRGR